MCNFSLAVRVLMLTSGPIRSRISLDVVPVLPLDIMLS